MRHENEVKGLALTSDGRWLLTVTSDARVRAWDWQAGKALSPAFVLDEGRGGRCMNVEITPDGQDVVVGAPRASVAFRLSDLVEPDASSPEDLVTFAELAANQRLEQGEPIGLDTDEWLDRWRSFRRRHPDHGARISAESWEELYRAAKQSLGRGDAALALAYLDRLAESWRDQPGVRLLHAAALSRLGRWDEAGVDLARLIELDPSDHYPWYQSAPLYLQRGDEPGYRRHCRRMLEQFGATADPVVAERTSKACLLAPLPESDREAARRLAERAVAMARAQGHSVLPWARLAQALADYRGGNFENASTLADEGLAQGSGGWNRELPAHLVRAMADFRLGRIEEARAALTRVSELFRTQLPKLDSRDLVSNWHDWLICDILYREARALILNADFPADPFTY
jgi:tetratricopeptide (TPR) repeat protein